VPRCRRSSLPILLPVKGRQTSGAANEACLRFLAALLGLSRTRLSIVHGAKSRRKVVCLEGISVDEVRTRLKAHLPEL
jgi:uncharacterized protein YggU (UPF0235/DUF167 family)